MGGDLSFTFNQRVTSVYILQWEVWFIHTSKLREYVNFGLYIVIGIYNYRLTGTKVWQLSHLCRKIRAPFDISSLLVAPLLIFKEEKLSGAQRTVIYLYWVKSDSFALIVSRFVFNRTLAVLLGNNRFVTCCSKKRRRGWLEIPLPYMTLISAVPAPGTIKTDRELGKPGAQRESMATRRSRQAPFYGWVCEYCLEVNPWNTQLLTTECSCPVIVPVEVAINDEEMLERIRPLPRSLPSGRFILCKNGDGSCYRGNHCTYAHSKAEQEAWNAQLDTEGVSKIGSEFLYPIRGSNSYHFQFVPVYTGPIKVPPSPRKQKVPTQEEFPVLSPVSPFTPTTALSGFSYAQAMRPRRQAPPFRQQIRPQQQQFPPFEVQRQLHNQQNRPVFSNPQHILHQQFGMPRPPPMIPTPHSHYKPPYGHPQVQLRV